MENILKNDKCYINEEFVGNVAPITKDQSKTLLSQLEKYVCKIYQTNGNKATGFLCKVPYPDQFRLLPVLMTCYHVLSQKDLINNNYIKITFDEDKIEKILNLKVARKIFENKDLDTFIIEIKPNFDKIYDFLDIDENIFDSNYNEKYKNITAYILQYPNGIKSSYSVGPIIDILDININHFCSTDFGSSGSPILNLYNYKVFGIHKRRTKFKFNQGTFIKFVIEQFNKENLFYQNQIIERNLNDNKKIINNNILDNYKKQISYNDINNTINKKSLNNSINKSKIDNYILIQNLGNNSFTDYYLAKLEGKDKYFFIKRIKEPMITEKKIKNNINYEIKILRFLDHPNIVKIEDIKKTPNHLYIIMEYINGGNLSNCLKKYMKKNKLAFSEQIVQHLMRQIINAIVYIHKNNIIHKNLSLDNIMVNFESDYDKQNLNMLKSKIKIIHFHENVDLIENDSTNNSNLKTFENLEPNLLKIFLK